MTGTDPIGAVKDLDTNTKTRHEKFTQCNITKIRGLIIKKNVYNAIREIQKMNSHSIDA